MKPFFIHFDMPHGDSPPEVYFYAYEMNLLGIHVALMIITIVNDYWKI